MIHDRSVSISLHHAEPRCEPSTECVMRGRCARYMAALARGADPVDYSVQQRGATAMCPGFLLLSHILQPAQRQRRVA